MLLKKAVSVRTFEALKRRKTLDYKQEFRFQNNQSGMVGEFLFANMLGMQPFPHIFIYDSEFETGPCPQLDFIVITSDRIFLYDVKYYSGIYYYEDGHFRSSQKKIHNPMTQLNRAYDVLDILLQEKKIALAIEKKLVFVNPTFTLYGNEPNLPIILHSQLQSHFMEISRQSSELGHYHYQVASYIESRKVEKNLFDTGIPYSYESLAKGVWCSECLCQLMQPGYRHFYCPECKKQETKSSAVSRSLEELRLLFPKKVITPAVLRDWCGNTVWLDTTRKIISQSLQHI